ncbi:MAG TPA: serine/threonine-protein kinase [Polyangiaceae bacterium]|nr:serine/threonine-protein kinase [Polyangiaceae bacterium]
MGQPGQVIAGRYRIERVLARGGHGTVFVAEQLATDAKVALKILAPALLDSDEMRRRFELEAKVAGRVASDFIVRVLDAGVDPATGLAFLAMELLEGESLAEAVEKHGPLNVVDATACMMQIAQGLDKAHAHTTKDGESAPIVHRDLKPENLFLTERDDGERITKILDFGIAKVVRPWGVNSRIIHGSPLYVAHEQLTGGSVGPHTDVWALGLLGFFILTGQSYWRSATHPELDVSAIVSEVVHMPIVAPSVRAAELGIAVTWTPAFDAWFLRCVHRAPQERFASAGAAAEAFFQALFGGDLSGAGEPRATPVPAPSQPKRALVSLALGGAAALAAGFAVSLHWDVVPSSHAEPLRSRAVASLAANARAATPVRVVTPSSQTDLDVAAAAPVRTSEPAKARDTRPRRTGVARAAAESAESAPTRRPVEWVVGSPLYSDR